MRSIKIKIPLTPKAKESARKAHWGGFYNPSSKGMKLTKELAYKEMLGKEKLKGPLLVIVRYLIPAPPSLTLKRRKAMHLTPHFKKPDGDNLEKFMNDSFNKIVWEDDAQIVWMLRSKLITYEKEGSTEIYISEISSATTDFQEILDHIVNNIEM